MAWLCAASLNTPPPPPKKKGDKISLFLSRLHNGSGGKNRHFPHFDWASVKKKKKKKKSTQKIWLWYLWEASLIAVGNDPRLCTALPIYCNAQPHFRTTNSPSFACKTPPQPGRMLSSGGCWRWSVAGGKRVLVGSLCISVEVICKFQTLVHNTVWELYLDVTGMIQY